MALEWKDLVDGEDYVTAEPINRIAHEVKKISESASGGETINIGYVNMVDNDGDLEDGVNATNSITYKPDFNTGMSDNHKPMAFVASYLGNGDCHGYIFYNHYEYWDYFTKSFDLYFHAYTDSGELKVVRLHYQYSEDDTSTPQSITAYLEDVANGGGGPSVVQTTGNSETAVMSQKAVTNISFEKYEDYKKVSLDIKHDGFYNQHGAFQGGDTSRSYAILSVTAGEEYRLTSYISSGIIPAIIYKNAENSVIGYDKLGTGTGQVLSNYDFTIPENCVTLIVQSSSISYELSLKKFEVGFKNKTFTLRKNITLNLGNELLTNNATLGTGWSGSNANGYTHASGNDAVLQFNGAGVIDVGEDYICEFDTTYVADDFLEVGIGNAYKILVYNGTGHIVLPLRAIGGIHLYFKPYKNVNFTISNVSLKRVCDDGEPKEFEVYNTTTDSNDNNYGYWNVVVGDKAMTNAVGSTRCIAIGNSALVALQGGHRNIAIGTFAMSQLIGGNMNVSIGADSMFEVKEAKNCIAIGKGAMHSGTKISNNIAIGDGSMTGSSSSNADLNIAVGKGAMESLGASTSSTAENTSRNIAIGYNTANGLKIGIANIYIGDQCEAANGKNQNVVIGASAKATGSANRSIAIGYQANTSKENQCVIGGANITEFVLGNKKLIFNADGTVSWESIS